ncbi:MAG TPA: phosphate signaling complex protein PhoU [Polyangiaceae bacterium]|nr:phosphate signaling complex protein PhoU [Polyangiaceae bacterium]
MPRANNAHTVRQFDTELEELRGLVLKMGTLVVQQIKDGIEGLLNDKLALAKMVQRREDWVDAMEVEADDLIVDLLVRRQPVGPDLRAILSLGKSVRDLERMGDEAERISRTAIEAHERNPGFKPSSELLRDVAPMGQLAIALVEGSLRALTKLDLSDALAVTRRDEELDGSFRAGLRRLATFIMEDSRTVGNVIDSTFVLKSLERIGDHATNIAEHVIYLVRGKDVRHLGSSEEIEKALKTSDDAD